MNLTLALNDATVERAREVARQQGTSLNQLVREYIEMLAGQLTGDDPKLRIRAAAILLRFATPSRLGQPAAEKQIRSQTVQDVNDLISYVEAPLPGQPGAPEDMEEEDVDDL